MLEASNWKTMESWYQNLSPYVNDKEFPLRGGKKDLPPVLIGLMSIIDWSDINKMYYQMKQDIATM